MPDSNDRNPLAAYGDWLAAVPDEWHEGALTAAVRAFVDVIGVAIPGAAEPVTRKVLATAGGWGRGDSTVIGGGASLSAPWAALVNGTAAHALDFDDNFDPPKAHATAVLVPSILALAQAEKASGRRCLDAYIAGLQIMGRVGQGLNPAHRNRGWHATATVGAVGAAAAGARLLGLKGKEAAFAISISTSMAGGFMSQFGTVTKPLHAGLAAKAGVMAASLARAGLDAGLGALDGDRGMNRLMVGPDLEDLRAALTHIEHGQALRFETANVGEPLLLLSSGLKVKRFPNCGSAHRAMDGFLALKERHGFEASDIASVRVAAPVTHLNNLMYTDPRDPPEARFSLEYAIASLAVRGRCSLADFEPDAVLDPEVRALYGRIVREPVNKPEGEFPTRVELTLRDGTMDSIEIAMPVGSLAAPLTDAQLHAKFEQCTTGYLSSREVAKLLAMIEGIADLPSIDPLMDRLGRAQAQAAT